MKIAEHLRKRESEILFQEIDLKIEFFNSAILGQPKNSEGKVTIVNVLQALTLLISLIKRIYKNNFDEIHVNSSEGFGLLKDELIIYFISFFTPKRIYFQVHYSGINETFIKIKFIRRLQFNILKGVHKVILLSENFKQELVSQGFQNSQLVVLPNFHMIKSFNFEELKKNLNKPLELIFIGSINHRKGIFDLLEALKDISINYNLNVLGDFSFLFY